MQRLLACEELPWVEIVQSGALQSARAVQALVAAGVQGLVVAGTGNGTIHQAMEQALLQARAQGVSVWHTTRCLEGQLVGLPVEQGVAAVQAGGDEIAAHVIKVEAEGGLDAVLLPPSKARIAMMLQLACS